MDIDVFTGRITAVQLQLLVAGIILVIYHGAQTKHPVVHPHVPYDFVVPHQFGERLLRDFSVAAAQVEIKSNV